MKPSLAGTSAARAALAAWLPLALVALGIKVPALQAKENMSAIEERVEHRYADSNGVKIH